ncbi:MAG TPA: DUF4082 domain-containing protein [Thermoanaerobaculia bacterium]|jgi:hypothetical protein|nr:DUF4082 domain-containing protein [Thermoanaerobaculia bacterium]
MSRKPLGLLAAFALGVGVFHPTPLQAYKMMYNTSSSTANWVSCDYINGFAHWPANQGSISWYLNTSGAGSGKATVVQNALSTWTGASESDHSLSYGGTTSAGLNVNDSQNTMVWGSVSGLCSGACHAITIVRYNSSSQVLSEADIVLNDQMDWRTDGTFDSTCADGITNPDGSPRLNVALDTQAILTHELGHSIGLGHSTSSTATMGGASCKFEGRSPSSDDLDGLLCSTRRYPLSPDYEGYFDGALNCSQVSGWLWNSDRPNEPFYVNIVDGSSLKSVVLADQYRADLQAAGKGNGVHGFSYTIPSSMKNGNKHTIHMKTSGTGDELTWSPRDLYCDVTLMEVTPTQALSTSGTTYEVGTQFKSSLDGKITALGYYFAPNETGSRTITLWSDTGTPLGWTTISPSYGDYKYAAISSVAITANVLYRVSVTTFTEQSKTPCGLSTPLVNGPLTALQGFWKTGSGFPTTSSCSNYHVSVKFSM